MRVACLLLLVCCEGVVVYSLMLFVVCSLLLRVGRCCMFVVVCCKMLSIVGLCMASFFFRCWLCVVCCLLCVAWSVFDFFVRY